MREKEDIRPKIDENSICLVCHELILLLRSINTLSNVTLPLSFSQFCGIFLKGLSNGFSLNCPGCYGERENRTVHVFLMAI